MTKPTNDQIDDVQVLRHPLETLDGEPLWVVEYYDKNGNTIHTEHYRNRQEAYMTALMVMDAKII